MTRTTLRRFTTTIAALAIALTGVAVSQAPAQAAPTTSSIVSIAQRELNDGSRNYEVGTNCSYYGGQMFGWPACGGKAGWGGGGTAYAWCAAFAKYVWREGGVTSYLGEITGMAQSFKTYGQKHGTWHARGSYVPQPGDAVVFDWDRNPSDAYPIDHVGIVTSVSGGTLYTIEGNTGDAVMARSYSSFSSNPDIIGFTRAVGVSGGVDGSASIYGTTDDGRLTYTVVDVATGQRTHGAKVSTATLGFTPKAMATLNFNTILITSTEGRLYRVDVVTNNLELVFNTPVDLGGGWTHDLLAYDGNGNLFGIADGTLRRYDITATKPAAANITNNTVIDNGFTLKTLTSTGADWILGTTSGGALISYHINGAGDWTSSTLRSSTWQVFDALLSPGAGVYFAHKDTDSLFRYVDTNPYDGSGSDISGATTVDASGWTQVLLSAQPDAL
ncbi:CHAP domain-containing protein [Catellatospora sp. NPDC049609]|uniref:CHAP domain-containing protein n=1 Tax=Catellatospora sp. NPDC049609 TaxID=3155505 RepID=UPI00342BB019